MAELMANLTKKEKIEELCRENGLNSTLLKRLFFLAAKGYNNTELAQMLGIHRVTVQRYSSALREMDTDEYNMIYDFVTKGG